MRNIEKKQNLPVVNKATTTTKKLTKPGEKLLHAVVVLHIAKLDIKLGIDGLLMNFAVLGNHSNRSIGCD